MVFLDNLFAWYVWGISFEVFALIILGHFYLSRDSTGSLNIRKLRFNITQLSQMTSRKSAQDMGEQKLLVELDEEKADYEIKGDDDTRLATGHGNVLVAFAFMMVINFFSSCITTFGWLTRTK